MISAKDLQKNTKDLDLLLVEDDNQFRLQMGTMLKELFHTVDLAENGKAGLLKYEQRIAAGSKPYDLVITDINMPMMNGIEMIHAIYDISPTEPILVISAHNESDYLVELLHIGINGFLIKPLQHQSLINTLYQVTQAIVNERLVASHYKKIEQLNAELSLQSEKLRQSNEELHNKNIALEKSMRIIEGMHHKYQLYRKVDISATTPGLPSFNNEAISIQVYDDSSSPLETIEERINDITREYETGDIKELSFIRLSDAVRIYADALPDKALFTALSDSLRQLALAVTVHPKYTHTQDHKRIFNMLESFFFIYGRWENEWERIDEEGFRTFSNAISEEIDVLIQAWEGKS